MKISVRDLKPNPYRDLKRLPIDPERVEALVGSIKATDFWDNLLARKNKDGEIEIAYGHHRLAALKKARVEEIDIPVRKLSNDAMVKIMANENMQEWGHDAQTAIETVRAVLEAYDAGHVELPEPAKGAGGKNQRLCTYTNHRPYTVDTVADFIGWKYDRVRTALDVIGTVEAGEVDEDALKDLSSKQAQAVVQQARRASKATNSKAVGKKVAKQLAAGMRKGSGGRYEGKKVAATTIHNAKAQTDRIIRDHTGQGQTPLNKFVRRIESTRDEINGARLRLLKLCDEMTEQGVTHIGGFEILDLNKSIKDMEDAISHYKATFTLDKNLRITK